MYRRSGLFTAIFAAFTMLVLILDSKTALSGASEGLEICVRTLVPSLLPFFVLSAVLTKQLSGKQYKLLTPLGRLCAIPPGQETLFIIGILGGYPTGAHNTAIAYQNGCITKNEAERMLGFCSNAGPSFIFGVTASLFTNRWIAWVLWFIHILSAILVGYLLPCRNIQQRKSRYIQPRNSHIIQSSLKALASVCCWVILTRTFITFLSRWFLWMLPKDISVSIIGFFELTNGCCSLSEVGSECTRFVLCSAMLAIGGVCILAQTVSVIPGLSVKQYIHGKLLQTAISIILAAIIQPLLFPADVLPRLPIIGASSTFIILNFLMLSPKVKKDVAF